MIIETFLEWRDEVLQLRKKPKKFEKYLEDRVPGRGRKWLITMVIISPLRIGLWDPFQMA